MKLISFRVDVESKQKKRIQKWIFFLKSNALFKKQQQKARGSLLFLLLQT